MTEKKKSWLEEKKEKHKKELEKISEKEGLEEILETPEEDNLEEILENLEEEIQKNIQQKATQTIRLAGGNVALNMGHGRPILDLEKELEEAPKKEEDDDDDEKMSYIGVEKEVQEYKTENAVREIRPPSQVSMTTPEKILEDAIQKYTRKEKETEFLKPVERKMSIVEMTRKNYQKKDYE